MSSSSARETVAPRLALPPALERRFEAAVLDWDATLNAGPHADTNGLRPLLEDLCGLGLDLAVITKTPIEDLDGRLGARPHGPGRLFLCVGRGSEVFEADEHGLRLRHRRETTEAEEALLDDAAAAAILALGRRELHTELVSRGPNHRRIGPAPDAVRDGVWDDPPDGQSPRPGTAVGSRTPVEVVRAAAAGAGLPDARVTSDAQYVDIGLTDKIDSARWALSDYWARGIGASAVLVAGDEFGELRGPAGGPELVRLVLADQLGQRRRADLPLVDPAADWKVTVDGFDPRLARVHESLLTLADGRLGTRGSPLAGDGAAIPTVFLAGVYQGAGPEAELAPLPHWSRLAEQEPLRPLRRTIDLRTGVLYEEGPLTSLRFSSLARPATVVMRASGDQALLPADGRRTEDGAVSAAFCDTRRGAVLDRIGAYDRDPTVAAAALATAEEAGFECLLREHREAWAQRWEEADVVVDGDPELQQAIRFTLFHMMSSVAEHGEAAVGARGLTGPAYRGHVFWDSDVFVLPFLAATRPAAARAMLEYRVRRLPAARAAARRLGRDGARFPWESAADGGDVTPTQTVTPAGKPTTVRTGQLEEHIVADVAWATACYLDWSGDEAFAAGAGRDLLIETARYWASRVRRDSHGDAHIDCVIGPDEYHESVDDNAFTNVMARWNLRRAAALDGVGAAERTGWCRVADALVDGYDPQTGVYEQFAGFFGLEPIMVADIAPRRPIAADLLFGTERTAQAQVLKQADVLMLHHLVPDEVVQHSLVANLDFYEPRTAHGSSLSPAVHAALFARAGRFEPALHWLRIAARMDLDDLTGSTAGGLHLATMGGLWQALVYGFAGVRAQADRVVVDPRLPPQWNALELCLRYRGTPFRLRIEAQHVEIDSDRLRVHRVAEHWEVVPR